MAFFRTFLMVLLLSLFPSALHADQNNPELDTLFAQLQEAQNQGEAAQLERQIWEIWHTAPNDELQQLMRDGMRAMNEADFGYALDIFDQMIEKAPDYAEGWNKRATVNYLLHRLPESLADIKETLVREPRHFGALTGRGLVYIRDDMLNKAIAAFEEALKISPKNPGSLANLDAIRRALGEREI